jgi:hypothetical protein
VLARAESSDQRKTGIGKRQWATVRKTTSLVLCLVLDALLFALCVSADAQQTGEVFRIGFLDGSTAAGVENGCMRDLSGRFLEVA